MAERSEAKNAKRSFASKYFKFSFLTRSFASRFWLRFAHPFLAKFNWTTYWSLSPQGLKREAKLRFKKFLIFIFDAKLRFALLASLRYANFSLTQVDN